MDHTQTILNLLDSSHSPFHAVDNIANLLLEAGYAELDEKTPFACERGKGYFVRRNDTSLLAFFIPENAKPSFKVTACHSDSPTYKLKPNPVLVQKNLIRLDVEPYGGMIAYTWMDRPLSLAGRIMIKDAKGIHTRFLDIDRDLCEIPSVCIHMRRDVNSNLTLNPAVDMLPIMGCLNEGESFDWKSFLEKEYGGEGEILGTDLFLYVREPSRIVGKDGEFLASPRLDDLSSAYASILGFLEAKHEEAIDVFACFDNEEVGSLTRQGANSTFLKDILSRVSSDVFTKKEDKRIASCNGFLFSVDNAHANHPNHPELSDAATDVRLNGGIVLKYNANQSYTTDGFSCALVKVVAEKAGVAVQEYTNRSDLRGGSTLGNISNSEMSFLSADIGIAQLAMHSSVELCGIQDLEAMVNFVKTYYDMKVSFVGNSLQFD